MSQKIRLSKACSIERYGFTRTQKQRLQLARTESLANYGMIYSPNRFTVQSDIKDKTVYKNIFEVSCNWIKAAEEYKKSDNLNLAAQMYEKAGYWNQAWDLWLDIKEINGALRCLPNIKNNDDLFLRLDEVFDKEHILTAIQDNNLLSQAGFYYIYLAKKYPLAMGNYYKLALENTPLESLKDDNIWNLRCFATAFLDDFEAMLELFDYRIKVLGETQPDSSDKENTLTHIVEHIELLGAQVCLLTKMNQDIGQSVKEMAVLQEMYINTSGGAIENPQIIKSLIATRAYRKESVSELLKLLENQPEYKDCATAYNSVISKLDGKNTESIEIALEGFNRSLLDNHDPNSETPPTGWNDVQHLVENLKYFNPDYLFARLIQAQYLNTIVATTNESIEPSVSNEEKKVTEISNTENIVNIFRGFEIIGGTFVYKVKVLNNTLHRINDIKIQVLAYPNDCLNADTTERTVSKIEPNGGFRSLEFKFTPTHDCVQGLVNSLVTYIDSTETLQTQVVEPIVIKSVCDLLKPLEGSKYEILDIIDKLKAGTQDEITIPDSASEMFQRFLDMLPEKNFAITDSDSKEIGGRFMGDITAAARGKYTNENIGLKITVLDNGDGSCSVHFKACGNDQSMLPTAVEEVKQILDTKALLVMNIMRTLNVIREACRVDTAHSVLLKLEELKVKIDGEVEPSTVEKLEEVMGIKATYDGIEEQLKDHDQERICVYCDHLEGMLETGLVKK